MKHKPESTPPPVVTAAENGDPVTVEAARKRLMQEEERRRAACAKEIEAALQRHGFELKGRPYIRPDGGLDAAVVFVVVTNGRPS